jgi:hypothetical protein
MAENNGGLGQAPLARASLALGIGSLALVFGIGLCALTGAQQGWLQLAGTPLYVCGASAAFLGLLAGILGAVGLFGKGSRTVAIVGLVLGGGAICLFLGVLRAVAGG